MLLWRRMGSCRGCGGRAEERDRKRPRRREPLFDGCDGGGCGGDGIDTTEALLLTPAEGPSLAGAPWKWNESIAGDGAGAKG